jgi:hypothetical protein
MTDLCRTPNGTMSLRPSQAITLFEAATKGDWGKTLGVVSVLRTGGGKAQPDTEPVLTPEGWKPIGTVREGDLVIGSTGQPVRVTGVFPQGLRDVYRVTFTDGAFTLCDAQHLWEFKYLNHKPEVRTLAKWAELPLRRNVGGVMSNVLRLRTVQPIERAEVDLPLDPYTLGALLGDGGMSQNTVNFTTMDPDILSALVLPGVVARETRNKNCGRATQYNLVNATRCGPHANQLQKALRHLGLAGRDSHSKFIPVIYRNGSIAQRIALLQGLFDTDGHSRRAGLIEYCTVSAELADHVTEIVESLGGTAHLVKDAKKSCFRLNCKLPKQFTAFRCSRKQEHHDAGKAKRQREPKRCVKSITLQGREASTCISVDAADHLYVTRHHILTHNTIQSGLLPFVLDAQRPLLLVPAKLRTKTRLEFQKLRLHWKIPKDIRIESYEKLGLERHANLLTDYQPDVVVCDEAQALKHLHDSARARRLGRYKLYFPDVKMCFMTATPGEVDEFAHLLHWALGDGAPVPKEPEQVQAWARVLNAKVADSDRGDPEELVPHLGAAALDAPRAAFRERLIHTPGVIVSVDRFDGCGLIVKPRYVDPSPEIENAFTDLRLAWSMPDGWDLADAQFEVWHSARQLGLGYYYKHDPRPSVIFRDIRRKYCKFVRVVLEYSEQYDTELQVRNAIEAGQLKAPIYTPSENVPQEEVDDARERLGADVVGLNVLAAWQKIQPTYIFERYPVWLSESVVDNAIKWGRSEGGSNGGSGGIIWVDSVAFATKLVERTGWPYFRNLGRDQNGRFIESDRVRSTETVIASIESNKEGRNLQHKWHRNLIVDPPNTGDDWEQLVSRTHRDEQPNANVFVDYMITCYEYYNSLYAALHQNECDHQSIGQSYRLLNGDVVMPSLVGRRGEYAWQKSNKRNKVTID